MRLATFARRRFVEKAPRNKTFDALHRIADRHYPALRDLFAAAWPAMVATLDDVALRRALLEHNLPAVMVLLEQAFAESADATIREPLRQLMQQIVVQGAEASQPAIQQLLGPRVAVAFNQSSPYVLAFVAEHSGALIQGINTETRQAVRSLLLENMERGRSWQTLVPEIRQLVGVTRRQAEALGKLRARAEAQGMKPAQIEKLVASKTRQYKQLRARTIARHETLLVANEGQRLLWMQLQEQGVLDAQQYRRYWIVTPDERLCTAICRPIPGLNAHGVGIHDVFESPIGPIAGPPAHILCRCAQVLRRASRSL